KIMEQIIKISSKGRAVGIILLASAQRMDADVMNTKARGNFSIRMSFRTVDKTNSMLLGCIGAEKIKREEFGRLILNCGELQELQSPYLKYEKAKKILNPYCVSKGNLKDITEVSDNCNTNTTPTLNNPPKTKSEQSDDDKLDLFLE